MVDVSIAITEKQYDFLSRLSRRSGESFSSLMRQALELLRQEKLDEMPEALEEKEKTLKVERPS